MERSDATACILADGYDREVFERILAKSEAVDKTKQRLERLLPHGEALLQDLFSALYKLNIVLRPAADVSGTVLIHRRILESVMHSRPLHELRKRTELSEAECAAALPVLADKILGALTREYRFGAGALSDLAALAEKEESLEQLEEQKEHLDDLPEDAISSKEKVEASIDQDISKLKREIDKARNEQAKMAARLTTEIDDVVHDQLGQLPSQIDEAAEHLRSLGLGAGRGAQMSAERRLELGQRLMKSKKLQLLARLVGAFREVALEARRKRVVRSPQTLHSVHMGADLERMLPSEILGLDRGRRALHLDFLRRYVEGRLLVYELTAASSRGPMVVCVDGSSSMSGSKEIWAKAVALTLMEIARREKRRCLAIVFSSGAEPVEFEFLAGRASGGGRARIQDEEVLRFAEHFPGGGTSFEEPLSRAVDAVAEGTYRRGDIVFITDGEANVSNELVERLKHEKKKHRFSIRGILVDVAFNRSDTLESFCDEVRKVSDLASESMADLFAAV
jgi:uncharacterized protein with von Willebrand factor type A (vWA) domain